jgi:hypothetical protein
MPIWCRTLAASTRSSRGCRCTCVNTVNTVSTVSMLAWQCLCAAASVGVDASSRGLCQHRHGTDNNAATRTDTHALFLSLSRSFSLFLSLSLSPFLVLSFTHTHTHIRTHARRTRHGTGAHTCSFAHQRRLCPGGKFDRHQCAWTYSAQASSPGFSAIRRFRIAAALTAYFGSASTSLMSCPRTSAVTLARQW